MIVTVRIYKRHDPDIVSLIENYEFDVKKAVYCALLGYMKKEIYVITLPPMRKEPYKTSGRVIRGDIRLDDIEDEALIKFITQIPSGERNCAIKTILRLYLRLPVNETWAQDNNIALQGSVRRADAAKLEHRRKRRKTKLVSFQDKNKNSYPTEKKQNGIQIQPTVNNEKLETVTPDNTINDPDDITDLFRALLEY